MIVIIMRRAVIPEDEGRHFYIRSYESVKAAEDWIAAQKDEYFKPADYYIAKDKEEE